LRKKYWRFYWPLALTSLVQLAGFGAETIISAIFARLSKPTAKGQAVAR